MKLHPKSQWNESQIKTFLEQSNTPVRLAFMNTDNEPMICSLWFNYHDGALWSASHKNAYVISQLKHNNKVSFEISTNDYPYKGVRGKAIVELTMQNADTVLGKLIAKYLGDSNSKLGAWLMSRVEDEYVLKITPSRINAWDFSNRMDE